MGIEASKAKVLARAVLRNGGTSMKGVILCAGRGTRLFPLTHTLPKPLIPVGNRPILAHQLLSLTRAGIDEVALVVDPDQKRAFAQAVTSFAPRNMRVTLILQIAPRGTAHAVACVRRFVGSTPFLVLLGDNLFTWDLVPYVRRFREEAADALLMVERVPDPRRFGVVTLEGERVVALEEKPALPRSNVVLTGLYFLRDSIFSAIERMRAPREGELVLTDAMRTLIEEGRRVEAEFVPSWWRDVGTFEALLEANRLLLDKVVNERSPSCSIVGSQLQNRVSVGDGCIVENSLIRGPVVIGSGTIIRNGCVGPFTSIGRNVTLERCSLEHSIVMTGAELRVVTHGIRDSLIGQNTRIQGSDARTARHKLIVGDHGSLTLVDPVGFDQYD